MGARFTLQTDLSREEVAGKYALLTIGPEDALPELLQYAVDVKVYAEFQTAEIARALNHMDNGELCGDERASLQLHLEMANTAVNRAQALFDFINSITAFGPFGEKGFLQ